jgi:hypothetical protein
MTAIDVRRLFTEVDGKLFWNVRPESDFKSDRDCRSWNTRFALKEAGSHLSSNGNHRWIIGINGKLYQRAHLIWLLNKGSSPPAGILLDHKNRNSLDDKISNLRLATPSQNGSNSRLAKNNTSGRRGVTWNKPTNKWQAKIRVRGKYIHLGLFTDLDEASKVYVAASKHHFGEFSSVA